MLLLAIFVAMLVLVFVGNDVRDVTPCGCVTEYRGYIRRDVRKTLDCPECRKQFIKIMGENI